MHKQKMINFTKGELDAFIEDANSCVRINNTAYSLALYPYHLSNVSESIKRLLNAKVAKYDQRLDGILLGYKNLKLITPYATLRADSCYIHVDIQGEFYIFKPKVGATLKGIANKTSSNHIGCLVHKVFNVSVPNTNEDENWSGSFVKIGNTVELSVTKTELDARLPYIQASILSCTRTKKSKNNSLTENGSPKKQKKKQHSETENNETIDTSALNSDESPKKQKKKKKHSETENNVEETPTLNESPKKQKKKKNPEQPENPENPENNNVVPSPEDSNKKEKKKNRHSDKIDNLDIKVEELSQKTLILESQKKSKKRQSQDLESSKITPKIQNNQMPNDSQRTNESDYFATPKIKKKQKQHAETNKQETPEPVLEKGSLEDFIPKEKKTKKRNSNKHESDANNTTTKSDSAKKKKNKQNGDINIEELQNSLLDEQLESIKEPKKEKKRKSKDTDDKPTKLSPVKPINVSPVKPMADLEDRKIKKRRQSLSQNVDWQNKELNLYDSDLEKTLNNPSDTKNIVDNSLEFNLAKIEALNANTPRKLKRKRKHDNIDDGFIQIGKKSKSKKNFEISSL